MAKKPKKSRSKMSLQEKEEKARAILQEQGYSEKEIQKIIDKAFYQ